MDHLEALRVITITRERLGWLNWIYWGGLFFPSLKDPLIGQNQFQTSSVPLAGLTRHCLCPNPSTWAWWSSWRRQGDGVLAQPDSWLCYSGASLWKLLCLLLPWLRGRKERNEIALFLLLWLGRTWSNKSYFLEKIFTTQIFYELRQSPNLLGLFLHLLLRALRFFVGKLGFSTKALAMVWDFHFDF